MAVITPPRRGPGGRPRIGSPSCWIETLSPLCSRPSNSSRSAGREKSSRSHHGGVTSGALRRTYAWGIRSWRGSASSASRTGPGPRAPLSSSRATIAARAAPASPVSAPRWAGRRGAAGAVGSLSTVHSRGSGGEAAGGAAEFGTSATRHRLRVRARAARRPCARGRVRPEGTSGPRAGPATAVGRTSGSGQDDERDQQQECRRRKGSQRRVARSTSLCPARSPHCTCVGSALGLPGG